MHLPMERSIELAAAAIQAGAMAVSLAPPRGISPTQGGEFGARQVVWSGDPTHGAEDGT